jgi:hypothetical protein
MRVYEREDCIMPDVLGRIKTKKSDSKNNNVTIFFEMMSRP